MKRILLIVTSLFLLQFLSAQNSPVAGNDTFTVSNGNAILLPVLSNDYDLDADPLTVSILTLPVHGTATIIGTQIYYTPNTSYIGNDSLHYVICDTTNRCDTAVVYLMVIQGNSAPVAFNDYYTVPEDASTPLPVTGNDFDTQGDVLSVSILTPPVNGTAMVVNNTVVLYTPNPTYFGADSLVYVICDGDNGCDTATVYITIEGVDSPPVSGDDYYTFADTVTSATLNVLANDVDPENDTLFITSVIVIDRPNSIGTIKIDSVTGELVFVRNAFSCGTEMYQYVVCDRVSCDTVDINITVTCPDNVFLPQGFSPDGDGKNDKLVFTGLEYFAPASLHVFNRYGTIVYESDDYENDWDGSYIDSGKPLPDGTYFYVLELADKRKYSNYLVINR